MKVLFTLILSNFIQGAWATCQGTDEYDAITEKVTRHFYDQSFRTLNWQERVEFYRKSISCEASESEVSEVVNKLLKELQASHTGLFTKKDLNYWSLSSIFSGELASYPVAFSGIWPIKRDGHWYAKFVLEGSSAHKARVRAGDRLLSIDGKEFLPLGFKENEASFLKFSPDGKVVKEVWIKPQSRSMQSHFLTASKLSEKIFKSGDKKIGYFHLWCGTNDAFLKSMEKSLLRFKRNKIDGLIIDLRDGFGGAHPEYLKLIKTDSYLRNIPKIFLINEGVTSGKEWVSALIKKEKLGILVGTNTAGAFLAGAPFKLLDEKYFLYLAISEFHPPGIDPLEGVGVSPDVFVRACTTFCAGKDLQLNKAQELMSQFF